MVFVMALDPQAPAAMRGLVVVRLVLAVSLQASPGPRIAVGHRCFAFALTRIP